MITCAFGRHSSWENSCSAAPISCNSISSPAPGLAAMDIQTSVRAMTSACGPPSISLSSARRSVSARSAGGATDSSGTVDPETICAFYTSSMFSERRICSSKIASSIPSMPESDFKKKKRTYLLCGSAASTSLLSHSALPAQNLRTTAFTIFPQHTSYSSGHLPFVGGLSGFHPRAH